MKTKHLNLGRGKVNKKKRDTKQEQNMKKLIIVLHIFKNQLYVIKHFANNYL